jgi:hypothetical protein
MSAWALVITLVELDLMFLLSLLLFVGIGVIYNWIIPDSGNTENTINYTTNYPLNMPDSPTFLRYNRR